MFRAFLITFKIAKMCQKNKVGLKKILLEIV